LNQPILKTNKLKTLKFYLKLTSTCCYTTQQTSFDERAPVRFPIETDKQAALLAKD